MGYLTVLHLFQRTLTLIQYLYCLWKIMVPHGCFLAEKDPENTDVFHELKGKTLILCFILSKGYRDQVNLGWLQHLHAVVWHLQHNSVGASALQKQDTSQQYC